MGRSTTARSTSPRSRVSTGRAHPECADPACRVAADQRLRSESVIAGAPALRPHDLGRLPARRPTNTVSDALHALEVRDHRLLGERPAVQEATRTSRGLTFATNENSYMIGCLSALVANEAGSKISAPSAGSSSRPSTSSSRATARVPAAASRDERAGRLLAGLRRTGQVQGNRAQPDRTGLEGRLPVAGGCGLGALDAAKEQNVWGLGVDRTRSSSAATS